MKEMNRTDHPVRLSDQEFKAFSQFGEDGILSWLTRGFGPDQRTFLEIGVGSYAEANTRYLASRVHNPWRGVIIDCDDRHLDFGGHPESWRWNVRPIQAMITPENADAVLSENDLKGEIGLLSIDIDGLDYWVWESIHAIDPRVVVLEYNSVYGPDASVTIPRATEFSLSSADSTGQYFGASLQAMVHLSTARGYTFVGATSTGVNAFFVRNDLVSSVWGGFPGADAREQWVDPGFGNVRDATNRRTRISLSEKQSKIAHRSVFNCLSGELCCLREVL